jgi:hypothetical protein
MSLQEAAFTATSNGSDFGALSGLVQAAGVLVSAGVAIGLTWRRRTDWGPVEQGIPKGAEKFGGLATAIALAILWTRNNNHASLPLLTTIAIDMAIAAFIALLVYGILNNIYVYEVDLSTADTQRSKKVIGGLWLEMAAQKGRKKGKTIQEMLKDAAYQLDRIWPRPARALAQALFVMFFIVLTAGGTVALSAAAMIFLINQTPPPAPPPTPAAHLKGLRFIILEGPSGKIASTGGPVLQSTTMIPPSNYTVMFTDKLIGQVQHDLVNRGGLFEFEGREGSGKVTITNGYGARWTCPLDLSADSQQYGVTDVGALALVSTSETLKEEIGSCSAGPVSQRVFDDFVARYEQYASPPTKPDSAATPAAPPPNTKPSSQAIALSLSDEEAYEVLQALRARSSDNLAMGAFVDRLADQAEMLVQVWTDFGDTLSDPRVPDEERTRIVERYGNKVLPNRTFLPELHAFYRALGDLKKADAQWISLALLSTVSVIRAREGVRNIADQIVGQLDTDSAFLDTANGKETFRELQGLLSVLRREAAGLRALSVRLKIFLRQQNESGGNKYEGIRCQPM